MVPYWSDEEEGDVYEGDPALPCPRPVQTSWSICWNILVLVQSAREAPVM